MKLANNVSEAMMRMKRMNELLEVFPGLDCGTCGAPTCRALAEDIVRGFAHEDDCVFRMKQTLAQMQNSDEFESLIPAPFREIQEDNE
jgi:Na+-translocating ferredoxin:NAD+ oxidoreductase RNF subunit RnfB